MHADYKITSEWHKNAYLKMHFIVCTSKPSLSLLFIAEAVFKCTIPGALVTKI